MRITRGIPRAADGPVALTIGNFDGVHLGHQALIAMARDIARKAGAPLGIVTFEPHPREFFQPQGEPFRLSLLSAKQRLLALKGRAGQEAEADEILTALEALAAQPGAILSAVVELNRRWQALDLSGDAGRLSRLESARSALQARFDREQAEQLAKSKVTRRVQEWIAALAPPETSEGLEALRAQLVALREEAAAAGSRAARTAIDVYVASIRHWVGAGIVEACSKPDEIGRAHV